MDVSVKASDAHAHGAVAVMKHRGDDNFKSEVSNGLFVAVRTQMVRIPNARLCMLVVDLDDHFLTRFQVERSFQSAETFDQRAYAWIQNSLQPVNTADRLTMVTMSVVNLRNLAKQIKDTSNDLSNDIANDELLNKALEIDQKLSDWKLSVPQEWASAPAVDTSPAALRKFQAYGDRMDIYYDVWVAGTWNSYRSSRILVNLVVLMCIDRLAATGSSTPPVDRPSVLSYLQTLVDDICASLPYHLGDKKRRGEFHLATYPTVDRKPTCRGHLRSAASLGGWFLMTPLVACLEVTSLPKRQKLWIIEQFERIITLYGLPRAIGSPVRVRESANPSPIKRPATAYSVWETIAAR